MRELLFWLIIITLLRISWRNPFYGLCIYIGFNIIRPEMLFWGESPRISVFLLFAFVLLSRSILKAELQLRTFKEKPVVYLVGLYLALITSMALSIYDTTLGRTFVNEIAVLSIICALLITYLNDFDKIILFEKIVIITLTLLGIWGIQQHFMGNERMEGIGGNSYLDSNGIAAMAVLFLPVALNLTLTPDQKKHYLWIISSVVLLAFIICTNSRGGAVGLVVAIGVYVLRTKYRIKAIIIGSILVVMVTPFLTSDYFDRIKTVKSTESFDASGLSRVYLWKVAWQIFKDNPVGGTGFLTFSQAKHNYKAFAQIDDAELSDYVFRPNKVGHNTYLQVLSEAGILGAIPYLLMIVTSIVTADRLRRGVTAGTIDPKYGGLATALQSGIIGFSVCIIAIDALIDVMLPVQITVCFILYRLSVATSSDQKTTLSLVHGESL